MAGSGYGGVWEYVSAVDGAGKPTAWTALRTITDGTWGGRTSGRVTFDPPRDWKPATVDGSASLHYVRFRATAGGTPPTATTVLGRDYTTFRNQSGTIPAFDTRADRDGDGYLTDAEYAARRPGFDARFQYECRLFYPNYGPHRLATNVSNASFRAWAANYHLRLTSATPFAAGFFVDNSIGRLAVDPTGIVEPLAAYTTDSGSRSGRSTGPRLEMADGEHGRGGARPRNRLPGSASRRSKNSPSDPHGQPVQFDDLSALLSYRRHSPPGRPTTSWTAGRDDPTDPRTLTTSLSMYYMLADPNLSFLMLNGGSEPNSDWRLHWTDAVNYNVGQPQEGTPSLLPGTTRRIRHWRTRSTSGGTRTPSFFISRCRTPGASAGRRPTTLTRRTIWAGRTGS